MKSCGRKLIGLERVDLTEIHFREKREVLLLHRDVTAILYLRFSLFIAFQCEIIYFPLDLI